MTQLVFICGGRGTRWPGRPAGVPKCMVELRGEPLLGRLWRQLREHHTSGAPIVVAAAGDPIVPAYVAAQIPSAIVVTQAKPDGVANAFRLALPHLRGPALFVLGDIVLDGALAAPSAAPALVLWRDAPPATTSRNFGVRLDASGAPDLLVEKPSDPSGLLCGIGIYLLTPDVVERFADAPIGASGEREITAALSFVLGSTRFAVWDFAGRYFNLNTASDLADAEAAL